MSAAPEVPVSAADPARAAAARALGRRWGLTVVARPPAAGFHLEPRPEGLTLVAPPETGLAPYRADFLRGPLAHRTRRPAARGEALARAAGVRGGERPRVVDATAGLGRDAWVLASLGCAVTALERSPAVAALLADALERAAADPGAAAVAARITLIHADAVAWLEGLAPTARPEVVYLDPMYPPRRASAKVRKELQLLQALAGAPADADALLAPARAAARRRVVVKRPAGAPPLGACPAPAAVRATAHRFDIYPVTGT